MSMYGNAMQCYAHVWQCNVMPMYGSAMFGSAMLCPCMAVQCYAHVWQCNVWQCNVMPMYVFVRSEGHKEKETGGGQALELPFIYIFISTFINLCMYHGCFTADIYEYLDVQLL